MASESAWIVPAPRAPRSPRAGPRAAPTRTSRARRRTLARAEAREVEGHASEPGAQALVVGHLARRRRERREERLLVTSSAPQGSRTRLRATARTHPYWAVSRRGSGPRWGTAADWPVHGVRSGSRGVAGPASVLCEDAREPQSLAEVLSPLRRRVRERQVPRNRPGAGGRALASAEPDGVDVGLLTRLFCFAV